MTTSSEAATNAPVIEKRIIIEPSPGARARKRMFGHYGFMIGAIFLAIIMAIAFLAPLISPHDPFDQQLARKLIPPIWHDHAKATWDFPLGTDQFGRDYLSRLIYGAQISLLIGFAAMLISGVIGTALGVAAGYFGGRVDMVVNFIITTRLSLPVVLVALAVVSLIGNSLWIVIWVLGLLIWDRFAVVMRSTHYLFRDHAEHRQQPDRRCDHRDGPCDHPRSGTVFSGAGCAAAGAKLGPDDCRRQEPHAVRSVAGRYSGYGAVYPDPVNQPARRRHP
jgi:hypothetical protein